MSEFVLTGSDVFGMYCSIEELRYYGENQFITYKVINSLRTNRFCDVPYKDLSEEYTHDTMEDCVSVIRCGVLENKVQRFRIADVKFISCNDFGRKELLEVADDMSRLARSAGYDYVQKRYLSDYAYRIRKALGATR